VKAIDRAAYGDFPHIGVFIDALAKDDGCGWDHHLRNAGFSVWQAV
jgi:hypothetical protein